MNVYYQLYHQEGTVSCLFSQFLWAYDRWHQLIGNNTRTVKYCDREQGSRVCQEIRSTNCPSGGATLKFQNVTMADHNTVYRIESRLIQIFVMGKRSIPSWTLEIIDWSWSCIMWTAPQTDPEISSLTVKPDNPQMFTTRDADYYFVNTNQPMIRVKCGVSINTTRPFKLVWYHTTTQTRLPESEAGDSLLANEPFTAQSQAWLRSTDKWLDLYVPVQALRRMSGQYSCYAESLYFYQQQTPATHAVIKWTWLWAFMGTCKCSDTCTCMYNLGQTRMSKVQLLLLVG